MHLELGVNQPSHDRRASRVVLKKQYLLRTLLWSLLSFVSNSQYLRRHGTARFARPVGASASKTKGPLKSGDL